MRCQVVAAHRAHPRRTSAATARASRVLLHPGCPYSSTPAGGFPPSRASASGFCCGHSTASCAPSAEHVSGVQCSPGYAQIAGGSTLMRWVGGPSRWVCWKPRCIIGYCRIFTRALNIATQIRAASDGSFVCVQSSHHPSMSHAHRRARCTCSPGIERSSSGAWNSFLRIECFSGVKMYRPLWLI